MLGLPGRPLLELIERFHRAGHLGIAAQAPHGIGRIKNDLLEQQRIHGGIYFLLIDSQD